MEIQLNAGLLVGATGLDLHRDKYNYGRRDDQQGARHQHRSEHDQQRVVVATATLIS
jgi:hypothetical protein